MTAPTELLAVARELTVRTSQDSWGRWPRASALLIRQAIDGAIDRLDPTLAHVRNSSARLMALKALLEDPALANEVDHAWGTLSGMIHHHAYELPPTAHELAVMADVAGRLVDRVAELRDGGARDPKPAG